MIERKNFIKLALVIILLTSLFIFLIISDKKEANTPYEQQGSDILNFVTDEVRHEIPPQKITLEQIFDGINPNPKEEGNWSLLVGGDVMIGRTVNYKTITLNNFDLPYTNLKDIFSQADYNFVNLESPVIDNCPIKNSGMIFCGNVKHIEAMGRAGINAVSLANNHMLNHGKEGLQTTLNYLQTNNITAVGVTNPTYVEIKGQKVALLAYTDVECHPGVACVDLDKIKEDVRVAKNNSDLVIIMYHWGNEYHDYPSARQKDIAHLSIDSGADLVLGNHPHWIQPFEVYKDKLIMYSHGNLVFDQMWSQKTREGVLVEYIFNKNNLIDAIVHPILMEDYGQPRLIDSQAKADKIEFIKNISEKLSTGVY